MKKTICMLAVLFLCLPFLVGGDEPPKDTEKQETNLENSVVRINVSISYYDFAHPWKTKSSLRQISGIVIDDSRILTHSMAATYKTMLTVYRNNDDTPYVARVLFADYESELCLLAVNDPDFFKGITPLEIGETSENQSPIELISFSRDGKTALRQKGETIYKEWILYRYAQTCHNAVKIYLNPEEQAEEQAEQKTEQAEEQTEEQAEGEQEEEEEEEVEIEMELPQTQKEEFFSLLGAPVLSNGKIVGIIIGTEEDSKQQFYAADVSIIRHFLTDIQDGHVDGFGNSGIILQPLVNADARVYYKMKANQSGIAIYKKSPGSTGNLKIDDVILAIDEHTVSNEGIILLEDGSQQPYWSYMDGKQFQDKTVLRILRNGKEKNITETFRKFKTGLKPRLYDSEPEYYIFGGYVFMSLNRSFLDRAYHPELFNEYAEKILENPKDEIIILSEILEHEINEGYTGEYAEVAESFNGKKIHNLKELIGMIENCKKEYCVLGMKDKSKFIMNLPKLKKASPEILSRHNIPSDRRINP